MGIIGDLAQRSTDKERWLEGAVHRFEADTSVVAAWLWGSEGRGDADELSDYDLFVAVAQPRDLDAVEDRFPEYGAVEWCREVPFNAPPSGRYFSVGYPAAVQALPIDWYWQPASEATIGTDTRVLVEKSPIRRVPTDTFATFTPMDQRASPHPDDPAERLAHLLVWFWSMYGPIGKKIARGQDEQVMGDVQLLDGVLALALDHLGTDHHPVQGRPLTALRRLADRMEALHPELERVGIETPGTEHARAALDMAAELRIAGWRLPTDGSATVPYVRDRADHVFLAELGRTVSTPVRYAHGPDSERHPDVPLGSISEHRWNHSDIFPGTERRYWVYVPAQYTAEEPASLLVVQDGWYYLDPDNEIRAAVVLDNLIHNREMPVTIAVFVDPGELPSVEDRVGRRNRNNEYDTFSDAYARLLLEEILPAVQRDYRITDDPTHRALAGGSSGGNCSLTVAWTRPDHFRKVVIFESSWPQVRGVDYERLILETAAKPLRIFMQASTRDLGWWKSEDNWFSANLRVAAALADRGYDMRLVLGDGPHHPNHAGVLLPDALRWLWRPDA